MSLRALLLAAFSYVLMLTAIAFAIRSRTCSPSASRVRCAAAPRGRPS